MAEQSKFPITYGKVPSKQRCSVVSGTILQHKVYGQVIIACLDTLKTEKVFNRLASKTKCDPMLFQNLAVFKLEDAIIGDDARTPPPDEHWETMETAPKDGREIILLVKKRAGIPHRQLIGHYMAGGHCIEDHPPIDAGWYFWDGSGFDKAAKPLLWMPLPEITPRLKMLIDKVEAEIDQRSNKAGE